MQQPTQKAPSPKEVSANRRDAGRYAASLFFLAALILITLKAIFRIRGLAMTDWPEAALVLAAAVVTIDSLSHHLPLQNVLLASVVIGFIGGTVSAVNALTGIPFGPCVYLDASGPKLPGGLPWSVPLIWIIAILNSRGVGRLILRPWRKTRSYGFWLMGLTAVLALALDLGLEPFCTRTGHYWFWRTTRLPFDWYGAPLTNFLVWPAAALLILAFATPALIRKKHGASPPDYHPLFIWLLLNAVFAGTALAHQLWLATALTVFISALATVYAVRGAKW